MDWHLRSLTLTGAALAAATLVGCARPASHYAIQTAMSSAYRPASDATLWPGPKGGADPSPGVLAGDLHCHVSPPDHPSEASRSPEQTVTLARAEGLDFVVLTPHVPARFFEDEELREWVLSAQDELRARLAAASGGRTVFVIGMEYTDHAYGHVGAAFADLRAVLADVPVDEARAHPGRFFERFVARGGLLVINHPLSSPIDSSISMARADLSWRPFTSPAPVPDEIAAANRLARGVEVYNMVVTHLRDRYLLRDTPQTMLATLALTDKQILAQSRRLVPVGGSDSHVDYLRPTTFVKAAARTETAIREAIVAGRVCVRSPEACSLEVRTIAPDGTPTGEWQSPGASLPASPWVEARAAAAAELFVNGASTATAAPGQVVRVALSPAASPAATPPSSATCSLLRARVGEGFSAPIYVGCPFAN